MPGERWYPALHRFSPFPDPYLPGNSHDPLVVPGLAKLGVLICYEDIVGKLARHSTAAGAEVLINLTNDSWFGESLALEQHLRIALFRAVENKRYLLRSTTTGATAVISPTGEIVAQAPMGEPFVLTTTVQPMDLRTFYTQFGDVFGWSCVTAVLFLGWRSRRMNIRQQTAGPQAA
jgi:apolipoprotein N-acyltransferase